MFYSLSTKGFYLPEIHGSAIPADAVEITREHYEALLAGQSQGKRITAGPDGQPVLQDPPPATAAQIWEAIKAERDRRKHGGVKVGDHWFHTDAESRIQQLGLVMMAANVPDGLQWKTMSGEFVAMTPALAAQIFQAVAAHDIAVFGVAETHRANMEASAEPHAYDYSTGWPAIFVGTA